MKKQMKIFNFIALFTLFTALYSCHVDDTSITLIENNLGGGLTSKKATLNQVLAKITNRKIREKVIDENENFIQNLTNINKSYNRIVIPDSIYTMIEYNANTSFLLPLNSYSIEKPYFLKLAINIDQNQQESFGVLKYIPTNPTTILDLKTFTGIMQVLDIDEEVKALTTFANGIPTNTNQTNANARMICYDIVRIIPVNCGLEGNHAPGVACNDGVVRGYYTISIQTICNNVGSTPFLTHVIEDSNYDDSSSVNVGEALAENFANTQLTPEQKLIYDLNPSIAEYLASNKITVLEPNYNPLLGGNPNKTIIDPQAEQFVLAFLQNAVVSGLNLDFEKSLKSPANIDFSDIDTTTPEGEKLNCIYNKLMQSNTFKNLINDTFGVSDKINIKFEIVQNLDGTYPDGSVKPVSGKTQLLTNNLSSINKF